DDAHGAEQYVADMWTVSASASTQPNLYNSLLAALRPGLSPAQVQSILDKSSLTNSQMPDVHGNPECVANVIAVLDETNEDSARFAWKLIRHRAHTCLFLVSGYEVTIRPLVPPSHTHEPFAGATQRIYM